MIAAEPLHLRRRLFYAKTREGGREGKGDEYARTHNNVTTFILSCIVKELSSTRTAFSASTMHTYIRPSIIYLRGTLLTLLQVASAHTLTSSE